MKKKEVVYTIRHADGVKYLWDFVGIFTHLLNENVQCYILCRNIQEFICICTGDK